jgi:hypothetical protein
VANIRNGNTVYVDATGTAVDEKNVRVVGIFITGAGGAATLVLGDNDSGASNPTKLDVRCPSGESNYLDFSSNPLIFPNGIQVKTLTTCVATLLLRSN